MSSRGHTPGVFRPERLSDEGLARLEKQLEAGVRISAVVLDQWIRRYGDAAREIIARYKDLDAERD